MSTTDFKLYTALILFTVEIPWDVADFYKDHVKGHEDMDRITFPNPSLGNYSTPLTVVDNKGRIVVWYLPGILSEEQQVSEFILSYRNFS